MSTVCPAAREVDPHLTQWAVERDANFAENDIIIFLGIDFLNFSKDLLKSGRFWFDTMSHFVNEKFDWNWFGHNNLHSILS
mmetsp:Transcript_105700/g.147374  ORF Transcript_105700/g.147374 Transcript_105700/m.147374 type:complete len:81 (+) Transcript_105700:65-307(+)